MEFLRPTTSTVLELSLSCDALDPAYCRRSASVQAHPIKETPRMELLRPTPLVAGEIGGFKREIALVGDTMNTAARIEQACRTTGHALLASKPLLDRTVKPANIVATSIGGHLLRGKSECLELFALERGTTDRVQSLDRGARPSAEAAAGDSGGFGSTLGGAKQDGPDEWGHLLAVPSFAPDGTR